MNPSHHHHHGNILVGRIIVVVGCLFILVVNALVFKQASGLHPMPIVKVIATITLLWMYAGAWLMCTRKIWGRFLVLIILYLGSLGFFLGGATGLASSQPQEQVRGCFIAAAIYLFVSLVLTNSRHVHRLTSRMWD